MTGEGCRANATLPYPRDCLVGARPLGVTGTVQARPTWRSTVTVGDLDDILDPAYHADLEARSTADIRRMRAECEDEEEGVSYARRLLQGRLDILRAELARREADGDVDAAELLDALPAILGTDPSHSGPAQARSTRLRVPESAQQHEARLDQIVDGEELASVDDHDVVRLRELVDELSTFEHELSGLRRALFERIDALRDELARRYKDGRADVSQLLDES